MAHPCMPPTHPAFTNPPGWKRPVSYAHANQIIPSLGTLNPNHGTGDAMPSLVERLTGKRNVHPTAQDEGLTLTSTYTSDGGSNSNTNSKTRLGHDVPHRRESSLLSLTNSVTDIGSNVRRSVSLRSHRTNPSNSSSFGNRAVRSPLRAASPRPSSGEVNLQEDTNTIPLSSSATQPPPLRRKISLSAKTLQHKFRSTEALPKLNTAVFLDNTGGNVRSPPASAASQLPPMLVGSVAGNAPAGSKRPLPELQTNHSFTRDAHSSHGTGNGASLQPVPSLSSASLMSSNSIYHSIQETSAKRMATIEYMRRLHEGDIYFFSTYHYSASSLSSIPSLYPHKLGRRATNYFILGYSLPALLDMNAASPLEYLKALSSLLSEFETFQNLSGFDASGNTLSKGRMGNMFKSSMGLGHRGAKGRRSSTVTTDSTMSGMDGRQADLLGIPSSASSRQSSFSHNMGSAGLDSPQDMTSPINPTNHEFSFLLTPHLPFEPDFQTTLGTLCDTLIDTYARLVDLIAGPESCSAAVGAEFAKADKAIRKILVANVVREFEDSTRAGVKGEVAGLGKLVLGGLM